MGFRSRANFNISLLAKQGWKLLIYPDSLVAQVLKAKYFPRTDFLNSSLGNNSSYIWKSIWASKGVLRDGVCWKVGNGVSISAINDSWIPSLCYPRLVSQVTNLRDCKVAELIDETNRVWKREVIDSTFPAEIAAGILCIPLARETHEDILAWKGESSGEFTVRSAYKLLQEKENDPSAYALQTDYRKFYKQLWGLNLPAKQKITVWRIVWNYLPTGANLYNRRITSCSTCSGCGHAVETSNHLFRECSVATKIWEELSFSDFLEEQELQFSQWITWVFDQSSLCRRRTFCCALWAIWGERNKRVHEQSNRSGKEIAGFIRRFISDMEGLAESKSRRLIAGTKWKCPPRGVVKVNFDAAFDGHRSQSAVGIVARDSVGEVLLSSSEIHSNVSTAFAAEALACRTAVITSSYMKWKTVIIEGDALSILKKCKKKQIDRSLIGAVIHDIQKEVHKFVTISFDYIPRSGNGLADLIATETLKKGNELYLINRVPGYAERVKEMEQERAPD
ncbi:hypothetical protein J1N35_013691 [Gossypium stocksii]|uniref:Reverse transcriptase n=1 Tax=Gossypium stocksii TaxID=47602 RepID=A0A9D4A845_9ROSI|nr:hypothetical protein J1N35_013691 [Gossypium stocksii]